MPSLVVLSGKSRGVVLDLSEGDGFDIGTNRRAQIHLRDRGVSYQHARIVRRGPAWVLRDGETPQGSAVNSERVQGERELRPGDVISVGDVEIRFDAGAPLEAPVSLASSTPAIGTASSGEVTTFLATKKLPSIGSSRVKKEGAAPVPGPGDDGEVPPHPAALDAAQRENDRLRARVRELETELASTRQTLDEQNEDLVAVQEELEELKAKLPK